MIKSDKITVLAIWLQPEVGMMGYYGCILHDGTPVRLGSKEKWILGSNDSLRKGWKGNIKIFDTPKNIYNNLSESELKEDGLMIGSSLELTVPNELKYLLK